MAAAIAEGGAASGSEATVAVSSTLDMLRHSVAELRCGAEHLTEEQVHFSFAVCTRQ